MSVLLFCAASRAKYGGLEAAARPRLCALVQPAKLSDALALFVPLASASDLPRLRRWLSAPEVARWWGDPREERELLRADLSEPRTPMRIVSFRGRPFAYARDHEVHAWPQPHLMHLSPGSRAINSFIGPPAMIGRGHGAAYLGLFARRLCAEGAPLVAIDHAVDNFRARRAYGLSRPNAGRDRSRSGGLMLHEPMSSMR
jgi:aminoglycoside 6'-N-acetyltransferase